MMAAAWTPVAVRKASRRTLQQYGQLLNVAQSALLSIPVVKTHGAEGQEERRVRLRGDVPTDRLYRTARIELDVQAIAPKEAAAA